MTQSPVPSPGLHIATRGFNPCDGDLVLAIDSSELPKNPLLAVCSKNGRARGQMIQLNLQMPHDTIVFDASKAVLIMPIMDFGTGILPIFYPIARPPCGRITYEAHKVYLRRERVLEAIAQDKALHPYLSWFETHFP